MSVSGHAYRLMHFSNGIAASTGLVLLWLLDAPVFLVHPLMGVGGSIVLALSQFVWAFAFTVTNRQKLARWSGFAVKHLDKNLYYKK